MGRWLMIACVAAWPASAQEAMPTYVSDQFKEVAQRVFRQLLVDELKNACPEDSRRAFCEAAATRLAEAFDAALRNDAAGLNGALRQLFTDSAGAALAQVSFDGLMSERSPAELAALTSIVRCVLAGLSNEPTYQSCRLDLAALEPLGQLLAARNRDCTDPLSAGSGWCRTTAALSAGQTVDPAAALGLASEVAASKKVRAIEASLLLDQLAVLFKHGLEGGLTDATLAYLVNAEAPEELIQPDGGVLSTLVDYQPTSRDAELYSVQFDGGSIAAALNDCQIDAGPFLAFAAARDDPSRRLISSYRRAYLELAQPDVRPLDAMLATECAVTADAGSAAAVASFRRGVRYFRAPLVLKAAVQRAAVPALLASTLLDYVRERDAAALDRGMRKAVVFGAAQAASVGLTLDKLRGETPSSLKVTTANRMTVKKVLESCEARQAAAKLGVVMLPDDRATTCASLVTGAGGAFPAAPVLLPDARELAAGARELDTAFDALFAAARAAPEDQRTLVALDTESVRRSAKALARGEVKDAVRTMARKGADFIAQKLNERVAALVGGASEEVCTQEARTVSIFRHGDAACALQLLIKSAYRPIVDFFWQGGFENGDTTKLASSTYRAMLAAPGIDRTPIILNFGLGASYIFGNTDVFGKEGYAAFTILDKFGLAFVKVHTDSFRFELGPFVGGFLDALIRTIAQEGKQQRSWLAGVAIGYTRMFKRELGIEMHLAAAMPYELTQSRAYGFAVGLTAVVPYTLIFSGD